MCLVEAQLSQGLCSVVGLMGHMVTQGLPGGSESKESTCRTRDLGSIPGMGRSLRRGHCNPLQYSCLENPHGQRNLVSYSPWAHKASDMTEQLT